MKASIIIPAYNCAKTVGKVIEACLGQLYPSAGLEIIIIDDGSDDNTAEVIKNYPVRYVYQENAGPARARNTGWKAAKGDIICFTDSDCIPEKGWTAKIATHYRSEEIGGVGGSYDIANGKSLLARCIHSEIILRHDRMPEEVNYLGSFNVSYRRKVLEETGGFLESFREASGEDNELAYRVRNKGYKLIFDKNAKVAHHHQEKLFRYLKEQFKHGYWRMKLYRLYPGRSGGDSYAGIVDFIQPVLADFVLLAFLVSLFRREFLMVAVLLAVFLLVTQVPTVFSCVRRERLPVFLYLLAVFFCRAFARGLGMAKGILHFFILGVR